MTQRVFDRGDGREHWVYAGVAPASMALALSGFFKALQLARADQPRRFEQLRIHFVGTSYAPADRAEKSVTPLAEAYGVADLVEELPARLPYFEALQCVLDADALIVPGSDDPGYTASKLIPYIAAQKPLLAVVHARSSVGDMLREVHGGTVVTFDSADSRIGSPDHRPRVVQRFCSADRRPGSPGLREVHGPRDDAPAVRRVRRRPENRMSGVALAESDFRPDIEGVRAIAIMLVVAFHARVSGFQGGFVGVDVFFVLSGYLITRLLLREIAATGSVDLREFYARRIRRLVPALTGMVVLVSAVSALVYAPFEHRHRRRGGRELAACKQHLFRPGVRTTTRPTRR